MDDTIYYLPKILLGEMLTNDGYTVYEGYLTFEKIFYLSIFYCLCFIKETSAYTVDGKVMEDTESDLKRGGGYSRVYHDRDDN